MGEDEHSGDEPVEEDPSTDVSKGNGEDDPSQHETKGLDEDDPSTIQTFDQIVRRKKK